MQIQLTAWPIITTVALELLSHVSLRLFLGEAGYRRIPIILKEALGTTILLGVWSVWLWSTGNFTGEAATLWSAAFLTGVALAIAHAVRHAQLLQATAEEQEAILHELKRGKGHARGS